MALHKRWKGGAGLLAAYNSIMNLRFSLRSSCAYIHVVVDPGHPNYGVSTGVLSCLHVNILPKPVMVLDFAIATIYKGRGYAKVILLYPMR